MVYHYTSIKTLGLILKNRKIRFTRFDLLDDRTEVEGLPELLKKRYFYLVGFMKKEKTYPNGQCMRVKEYE